MKKPFDTVIEEMNALLAKLVELKKEIETLKLLHENSANVLAELSSYEDHRIDSVLRRYGIVITGKDGTIIFPRKEKPVEKPKVVWDSSKKDPSKPN